jgi:hypothetical protein
MAEPDAADLEADPRFPSGPWTGFYLMPHTGKRRHPTSLRLSFAHGQMSGGGRDAVGAFTVKGSYDLTTGKCTWIKQYIGKHAVYYSGYNEGKGIWGTWDIPQPGTMPWRGGFHIWPEAFGDPTQPSREEEADPPVATEADVLVGIG